MKRIASRLRAARAGFTLIEMIGVLAIMAILASVLVPNVLRTMDRAAVEAEAKTLDALGEQVKQYAKLNGAPPPVATWPSALGGLADLAAVDVLTNRRRIARSYLVDTSANPAPRAMILSSLRNGLTVPPAAAVSNAQFQTIWQTADRTVPATSSWTGWSAWTAVAGSGEQLVIERVNLLGVYQSNPTAVTLTFNTTAATAAGTYSFRPPGATVDSGPYAIGPARAFAPGTIVTLYSNGAVNYTYAVGIVPRTFDLQGNNWIAQP
ncbi:MAG: prepilin-type N-terminal cleavage/methylation domain-containing protein [Opitutaceae bacterium]